MILRARILVTMDGAPIENGAVAIANDRITDVGIFAEISPRNAGEIVDLGERVLLPGLINAHCHLDYTCLRGKIPGQHSFTDWIRAINAEKAKLSPDDYVASINAGFAEAKRFGTTAIANLTAFPELISKVRPSVRTVWFPELIDVRNPGECSANLTALNRQVREASAKASGGCGLAPHALFTASADLYKGCAKMAPLLTTHLAESREEMAMFRDARGELYDFLKEIGRDMGDCGGKTPVAEFLGRSEPDRHFRDASIPNWIVAHLNELTEGDFDLLGKLAAKFSIVHCPRSHAYFGHSPFQFERLRQMGFNVCLGTDSLASNDDLNLFAEMRAFRKTHNKVSAEEIFSLLTVNAARAIGKSDTIGRIRPGSLADMIAVPASGAVRDVFESVLDFAGEPWVMISGEMAGN